MKLRATLFRRAAWSIGVGFLLFQLLASIAIGVYVVLPLERQSANDLAALLVLSARTWVELPPDTRAAYEAELAANHGLDLHESAAAPGDPVRQKLLYMGYLAQALERQVDPGVVARITETADNRFHVDIPMAGHPLRFSLSYDRINLQPLRALLVVLALATGISAALAWLLARRVSRPVQRLAVAARAIGVGERPAELPENVEQELADLAHVINQTSAKLAAQRENQDTLLAGVSHDLRSPLARLRMALGMLGEEVSSPLIARMEADVAAMNTLIGAQLELARVRQTEVAEPVDLDELLGTIADHVNESGAGLVRLRLPGRCPPITAAPIALRRLLANLVDNACLHAGDSPFELVRRRLPAAVAIGVRDRGPGVPPAMREAVFRPFVRVEPSRNRSTGGSGLGLAIARQLAETHGWTLALKTRRGGGASFWLLIPTPAT